jgi:hypothetical protein
MLFGTEASSTRVSRTYSSKHRNFGLRWFADTCHCASHKPFRLLFIMDLIAQGLITENFIEPSFERFDTWNG